MREFEGEERTRELEAAVLTPENRALLDTSLGRSVLEKLKGAAERAKTGMPEPVGLVTDGPDGIVDETVSALVVLGIARGIVSAETIAVASLLRIGQVIRERRGGFDGCDCPECRAARAVHSGPVERVGYRAGDN